MPHGYGVESSGLSHDESFGVDDLDLNVRVDEVVDDSAEEDVVHDSEEENEIVKPGVDVHMFGISKDVPFDNIGVTNLVLEDVLREKDVLRGEDIDVVNSDGFDSDTRNKNETSTYRRRRLNELRKEMGGIMNDSGRSKYSFYTG
nr:hypothetical protein [Tanacetum cinerariifolium]